ncbi:hypothetical protein FJ986_23485 [Mesorhizobium sp. B1-1-1]|nr:hypothetical protein FJ986_23485 [Mesorhizobium sp. B1-1-1]
MFYRGALDEFDDRRCWLSIALDGVIVETQPSSAREKREAWVHGVTKITFGMYWAFKCWIQEIVSPVSLDIDFLPDYLSE